MSSEMKNLDPGISLLLDNYFEVMHSQNMDLFDQVFHKDCCLYGIQDDQTVLRPYQIYRAAVASRQSPEELANPRRDQILDFDQISDTMACAKVSLQMFGGIMQDYLNLIKLDGKWWIIAKLYQQVGNY
jgi:hypothetical protein